MLESVAVERKGGSRTPTGKGWLFWPMLREMMSMYSTRVVLLLQLRYHLEASEDGQFLVSASVTVCAFVDTSLGMLSFLLPMMIKCDDLLRQVGEHKVIDVAGYLQSPAAGRVAVTSTLVELRSTVYLVCRAAYTLSTVNDELASFFSSKKLVDLAD